MNNRSAVGLFNTLAAIYYESCADLSKFGAVLQSHGLPTWLFPKEPYSNEQRTAERKAIADFLRSWADALEGKE